MILGNDDNPVKRILVQERGPIVMTVALSTIRFVTSEALQQSQLV
jgi:hypothetical protein